jgi:hypothetical protein
MLMDGDRLAEHITRCGECQVQGARLQVSNDGANWTNYTGAVENVEAYAHVRCVATVTTPWIDLKSTLSPKSADFFGIDRTVAPKLAPDFLKMHLALCRSNRGGDCNCFGLLTNDVPPPKLVINLECQGCGVGEGVQHHPRCPRLVPICAGVKSFPCFGARALRHTVKGKPPAMLCDGHYLHVESTLIEGPRMQTALSDPKVPERLDHRRPPMAHSFGVEDPALPNA